jgi:hypothetical protein
VAHLEQAWVEAKHTGDKDLRRAAKAPRGQVDRAQRLVSKLQACASRATCRAARPRSRSRSSPRGTRPRYCVTTNVSPLLFVNTVGPALPGPPVTT